MNTPITLSLVGATLLLLPLQAHARGGCERCHSDCNGQIITYNPDNGRTLSADIFALEKQATAAGAAPISCIRPQHCQTQLYNCYNACGQAGRAARHSAHTDATACDFNPRNSGTLSRLRRPYANLRELQHSQRQGGGLHDYSLRYVASNGAIPPGNKPAPVKRPSPRAPASNAPSDAFPNGRYKCASGMKSICGSTKDTPWCKSWIASGHTPGCFN
jgi:hypothetical protein